MSDDRLAQQIAFLIEADKLKQVIRRTPLADGSRKENSAEHSWHLALTAIVLREYSADEVDLLRVLEMLAVHDLVEIDAGDTFAYDTQNLVTKAEREQAAAPHEPLGHLATGERQPVCLAIEEGFTERVARRQGVFDARAETTGRFHGAFSRCAAADRRPACR